MKTTTETTGDLKTLAIMLILSVLLNGGLFAQKSLNNYDLERYSTDLFKNSKKEIVKAYLSIFPSEITFYEETMNYEDWMFQASEWIEHSANTSMNEMFVESEMTFEDWMLEPNWGIEEKFVEKELQFESWMKAPALWSN